MEFSQRLRAAREAAKLKQSDVAEHFGISRPTISQWEAGTHRPDQDRFPSLAALLGVTLDWLMNEVGDGPGIPARRQAVPSAASKFLKSSRHKFYVREWREFMAGDRIEGAARAAGLPPEEYQAFETYPINFTLGQIVALADELGIRGDQFWFPPPKAPTQQIAKPASKATVRAKR
jgi:transcriptional regulator with XRE-family HTH domain